MYIDIVNLLLIITHINCSFLFITKYVYTILGPYNTTYKSLRHHLSIAGLQSLISNSISSAPPSPSTTPEHNKSPLTATNSNSNMNSSNSNMNTFSPNKTPNKSSNNNNNTNNSSTHHGLINYWSVFTDVVSCLEAATTVGSPSGYALDAASASPSLTLPVPPTSVAHQMAHDHFKLIYIPSSVEYDLIQVSCICVCICIP